MRIMVEEGGCLMVGAFGNDRNQPLTLNESAPTSAADALLIAEYLTNHMRAKGSP